MNQKRKRIKGTKSYWSSWIVFLYTNMHSIIQGTIQNQLASCPMGLFYSAGFRNSGFKDNCRLYCIQGGFHNRFFRLAIVLALNRGEHARYSANTIELYETLYKWLGDQVALFLSFTDRIVLNFKNHAKCGVIGSYCR